MNIFLGMMFIGLALFAIYIVANPYRFRQDALRVAHATQGTTIYPYSSVHFVMNGLPMILQRDLNFVPRSLFLPQLIIDVQPTQRFTIGPAHSKEFYDMSSKVTDRTTMTMGSLEIMIGADSSRTLKEIMHKVADTPQFSDLFLKPESRLDCTFSKQLLYTGLTNEIYRSPQDALPHIRMLADCINAWELS